MRQRLPSSFAASSAAPDPVLVRLLWQWLALGLMLAPWLPAALAEQIGSPWLWAAAAPLAGLLILHRDILAAAGRRLLAPAPAAVGTPALAAFSTRPPADHRQGPMPSQARRRRHRETIGPRHSRAA